MYACMVWYVWYVLETMTISHEVSKGLVCVYMCITTTSFVQGYQQKHTLAYRDKATYQRTSSTTITIRERIFVLFLKMG